MAQSSNEAGSRLNLRIKFRSENLESFVERYGSDVSPGGIFIRSKTPLEIGTKVSFTLSLINGVPVLLGEGTVVWARKPEAESPAGNPGMGIRFDQLTDESRMKLNRVLEAKAAHDKAGKPSVRGPTPIPDPQGSFGTSEPTAKMRLTEDGRIVRDMPGRPPVAGPSAPAPSQPYAASFSQPQGTGARDADATQVSAPPTERIRRATPALGLMETPQPFAPSKTLGDGVSPLAPGGGAVVRAPKPPATTAPLRSPTPPFGTQPTVASGPTRSPAPGFTQPPVTRAAGGSAFSSTAAFGSEPTRMQGLGNASGPTRAGVTPGPDLLRRATPPPMPVSRPSSIFSKPTPTPIAPLNENRSGARSGPVVSRPSAQRPAVVEPPRPQSGGWGDDKTEIVEDLPPFDEIEEKTTTVRGQVLAEAEGFARMQPTRPDIPKHLTPRPPGPEADEMDQFPATPAPVTMPALDNLFDGEALPATVESASLLGSVEAEQEFGRPESTARGRRLTPSGPSTGTSMVARKVDYLDEERRRGRPALWAALGLVLVGAGVFAFVEFTNSQRRGTPEAPAVSTTPVAASPESPPPQEPEPAAAASPETPEPAAEPAPPNEPPKTVAEREKPAATPPELPKPAAVAKPAAKPAPRPRPSVVTAPAADEAEVDDADAIYWLRVRSVPAGAEVFIDGDAEGVTPFQRRIFDSTRAYALSVRKEGYESHERLLSSSDPWVKAKGEYLLTVTVKLRKLPGAAPAPEAPASEEASENGAVILDP